MRSTFSPILLLALSALFLAMADNTATPPAPAAGPQTQLDGAARSFGPATMPVVKHAAAANSLAAGLAARTLETASQVSLPEPVEIAHLDRWDSLIWKVAEEDPERAAVLKAFVGVESMGRPFAVSHTGCAGLMQFCARTAGEKMFSDIFRAQRISSCECPEGGCRVSTDVQDDLEAGGRNRAQAASALPCDVRDDRFDAERSLRAGLRYIEWLSNRYDGNLELTYVAYNSGPGIADRLYRRHRSDTPLTSQRAMQLVRRDHSNARRKILSHQQLPLVREMYRRYRFTQPVNPTSI